MLTELLFRAETVLKFKWFKWLLKICWSRGGAKGHIVGFGADPKGTSEAPKGTVHFGKGLAGTLLRCTW